MVILNIYVIIGKNVFYVFFFFSFFSIGFVQFITIFQNIVMQRSSSQGCTQRIGNYDAPHIHCTLELRFSC
jgi:hypothetical protein